MPKFKLNPAYTPTADQPKAIEGLAEGLGLGEKYMTLLGATGTGKTFTMAATIERVQRPGARDRPQQDACGAALQRVPGVLPRERGRVLRLLLRLLPARGLRARAGPLHREGLVDQRRDRPPQARGYGCAPCEARRGDRRLGLVHLRHRLARALLEADGALQGGGVDRARRALQEAHAHAVQPQRDRAHPRNVPRQGRDDGDLPRLRGVRLPPATCSATRSSRFTTSTP